MTSAARKPVIGLVGGIGAGKSTVARQFAALGAAVVDADALAQAALQEPQVRDQLVRWWGPAVLGADGRVDRKSVGRIVFDVPEELARLEGLIHPRVLQRRLQLHDRYQADPAITAIVEDTPLLMDKGLDRDCDYIVYVHASPATRQHRLAQGRGWTAAELAKREKMQVPLDIKRRRADDVVDNDAGEAESSSEVRRVFSRILQRHMQADGAGRPLKP